MKKRVASSHLFLTELLLSILLLIVIIAVCLQIFASADRTSEKSQELVQAVRLASDGAEVFYQGEDSASFAEVFTKIEDGLYLSNYNADFIKTASGDTTYIMRLEVQEKEGLKQAVISVSKADAMIYELIVEKLCQ
ncbi:MAG: hypothetical protein MJ105_09530 [Lachnospiraceae bacterium]|nr:hypothetical protein [Lachnospiraceae bacterium]